MNTAFQCLMKPILFFQDPVSEKKITYHLTLIANLIYQDWKDLCMNLPAEELRFYVPLTPWDCSQHAVLNTHISLCETKVLKRLDLLD